MFLSISITHASDPVSISVNPSIIGINETARIELTIINTSALETPRLLKNSDAFSIQYQGSSSQRQMQIINGSVSSQTSQTHIFEYIPKKIGTFTIPSFLVSTKNGTFETDPISIKVEEQNQKQAPSPMQQIMNPMSMFFDSPGEIVLVWKIPKSSLMQNTGFVADLYLYTENPNFLDKIAKSLKEEVRPTFDGGVLHSVSVPKQNDPIVKDVGFRRFYGKIIKSYVGFPMNPGSLKLHTPIFRVEQGPFSGYLQGDIKSIDVKSLPEKLSYIGNNLSVKSSLRLENMNISEENTLTISIKGDGNVDFFANPFQGKGLDNLFISDPKTELSFSIDDNRNLRSMKKVFTYKIIPKKSGAFDIPVISLIYYDFSNQKKIAKTEKISFRVVGEKIEDPTVPLEQLEPVNQIQNISSGIPILFTGFFVSLSVVGIAYGYRRRNKLFRENPALMRASSAKKYLSNILSESKQSAKSANYKKSVQLLRQSILNFCRDKFMIEGSPSPTEIVEFLQKNKIPFDTDTFLHLLDALDFYAFGASPNKSDVEMYMRQSEKILEKLNYIKIKKN